MIAQKLKRIEKDEYGVAERYYALLSALNDLRLTQRETQLVAYTAIRGNISYTEIKEEFCRKYDTSFQTISNMISKLKKINVLIKDNRKIKVNPVISMKFNEGVVLQITLGNG